MGVMQLFRTMRSDDALTESPPPVTGPDTSVQRDTGTSVGLDALERHYGEWVAPAAVRIRAALLLHRSGRKNEAWLAFERLLADPALGGSSKVRPMLESEIYSRMRICHEREGCFNPALTPAVLSYSTRAQFFALQERVGELRALTAAPFFDRHFTPLLQRTRLLHALPALRTLVAGHLDSLPMLDIAGLRAAIEALRENPPSAPKRAPGEKPDFVS